MSAPTAAYPHMYEPQTDTSRRNSLPATISPGRWPSGGGVCIHAKLGPAKPSAHRTEYGFVYGHPAFPYTTRAPHSVRVGATMAIGRDHAGQSWIQWRRAPL